MGFFLETNCITLPGVRRRRETGSTRNPVRESAEAYFPAESRQTPTMMIALIIEQRCNVIGEFSLRPTSSVADGKV